MATKLKLMATEATPLAALIEEFMSSVAARTSSPRTVESYSTALQRVLLPWAKQEGVDEPSALDQAALDRFSTYLRTAGGVRGPLSPSTVASYVRHVNVFLSWARKRGSVDDVRAAAPRPPRRLLEVLKPKEVDAMERAADSERDRLIIRLLADTGLRVGELLGLTEDDLVLEGRERYLRVLGKGAKERLVPVTPALFTRLRHYLQHTRPQDAPSNRIFVGLRRSRQSGFHEALTKSGVEQLVRYAARKAGIQKRVWPHLLRHSFATTAINDGLDPISLQRILGHESLEMISRVYANQSHSDLFQNAMRMLARRERG